MIFEVNEVSSEFIVLEKDIFAANFSGQLSEFMVYVLIAGINHMTKRCI